MTYQQFLQKLRRTRRWKIVGFENGILRSGQRCPITAVHGKGLGCEYWTSAAASLGLETDLACSIVRAADNELKEQGDGDIRRDLLRACGFGQVAGYGVKEA